MLFFDLETTGLRIRRARIVELGVADARAGGVPQAFRFHPGGAIPPEATAVHGITDADVADAPRFEAEARQLQTLFQGRRLCGYNNRAFDTPLLDAELRRAGLPGLDLRDVEEVDLLRVWLALWPREGPDGPGRSLTDAARTYLGVTPSDPHSATGDVRVVMELFEAMRARHGLGVEEMLRLSNPPEELDRSGKLLVRDGEVVFAFGRHRGEPVARHRDYLDWMLRSDFPEETKARIRELQRSGFRPPADG